MTVIDLREELFERRIEIIEVTDLCVYYAEELNINGTDTIYIYCYDLSLGTENIISYFSFEDDTYLQHYYIGRDSIIVLFENDGSKVWIIKIDKHTDSEVLRKKLPLIGRYFDCVAIDDNNIIIYSKSDDEYGEIFDRCLEETNFDTLANLYDLKMSYRYFVRDFRAAMLVKDNMHRFTDSKGVERMILCEPYCVSEIEKEKLFHAPSGAIEDMRDYIWEISVSGFLDGVKNDCEKIGLTRIASAGSEGLVRYECSCGDGIVFRAKAFTTGREQFLMMSASSGEVRPICSVRERNDTARYFTDSDNGKIYYTTRDGENITLRGEINSAADITYPYSVGRMLGCIEDRFIIADSSESYNKPRVSIYDGKLNMKDTYQARTKIKNNILVLY